MLQAGERIVDGQLPYRDFYANYGPGQYFLIGGLDWLFGPSLLTWRILRVALDAGVAVLAYALVRRDAPEPLALGAWLTVAAAMAFPSIPHPNPTALALAFGGLLIAERKPAAAGALAGLAAVFRLDLGLAALAGTALLAGRRGAARARRGRRSGRVRPDGTRGDRGPGCLLGPDDRIRARPAAPPAPAAPGRLARRLRAQQDPRVLHALPAAGGDRALARGGHREAPPVEALGTRPAGRGRSDLPAGARRRVPPGATGGRPSGAAGHAAAAERRTARAGNAAVAVALVAVLALIALQGLDRKRIQLLDPPPQATIDIDVADGVKAPTAEAHALSDLSRYVRARCRPDSRSSSPTRASTWCASATRSSTCWSAVPTRPATT